MKLKLPKINIKNPFNSKNINPHTHWKFLLYLFSVVVIFLILFSFYLLFRVKSQQAFKVTPVTTEPPSLVNEKLLEKVNESFNSKLLKQKEIKEGPTSFKDPSI